MAAFALPASSRFHGDTTSLTLWGKYENPQGGVVPRRGHNKDGHPECVQVVAGQICRPDGIPVEVQIRDGNYSDNPWSRKAAQIVATILY